MSYNPYSLSPAGLRRAACRLDDLAPCVLELLGSYPAELLKRKLEGFRVEVLGLRV